MCWLSIGCSPSLAQALPSCLLLSITVLAEVLGPSPLERRGVFPPSQLSLLAVKLTHTHTHTCSVFVPGAKTSSCEESSTQSPPSTVLPSPMCTAHGAGGGGRGMSALGTWGGILSFSPYIITYPQFTKFWPGPSCAAFHMALLSQPRCLWCWRLQRHWDDSSVWASGGGTRQEPRMALGPLVRGC